MKITRRDLGVLMILVGIIAIFLTYRLSFVKKQEEVEALQAEQSSLRTQIDELQPIKDAAEFYEKEMDRFEKEIKDIVEEYPVNVLFEDGIMYVVEIADELDVEIPNLTFTPSSAISTVEGAGIFAEKKYELLRASESMTYTVTDYDTLKKLLDYVYSDKNNRKTITTISMTFDDATGEISGSLNINMFALSDGSRVYEPVELPLDKLGLEHIFGEVVEKADK